MIVTIQLKFHTAGFVKHFSTLSSNLLYWPALHDWVFSWWTESQYDWKYRTQAASLASKNLVHIHHETSRASLAVWWFTDKMVFLIGRSTASADEQLDEKIATNGCSYFQAGGPEVHHHCLSVQVIWRKKKKKPTEAAPLPHKLHANIKTGRITGGVGRRQEEVQECRVYGVGSRWIVVLTIQLTSYHLSGALTVRQTPGRVVHL